MIWGLDSMDVVGLVWFGLLPNMIIVYLVCVLMQLIDDAPMPKEEPVVCRVLLYHYQRHDGLF